MAWTTMHFAVGMGCAGVAMGSTCLVLRPGIRALRWLPLAMTLGGLWALMPDMPRVFREDFPNAPFASSLGSQVVERFLFDWGDVFFFHHMLDLQPQEYALHGVALIILFYNASILLLMWLERRQRFAFTSKPEFVGRHHRPPRSSHLWQVGSAVRDRSHASDG